MHKFLFFVGLIVCPTTIFAQNSDWNIEETYDAPQVPLQFSTNEGTWLSLDISPDGSTIIFDLLGHLYEMPVTGGDAKVLTRGRSWNMFPRYSPDGTKILYTSDKGGSNDLWVMDRSTGKTSNISNMDRPVFQGTWSRDGRHVYGTSLNMRVRFPVYMFNMQGAKQELLAAGARSSATHWEEHPKEDFIYFEHQDGRLPASGPRVKTYDKTTGEIKLYIQRAGGAFNPAISPDGNYLAYVGKQDLKTSLFLHDLRTRKEKVLSDKLDFGRANGNFYGAYSNMTWHPSGNEILISYGGKIISVAISDGSAREISFNAPVDRSLDQTIRFQNQMPSDKTRTRSHRWAQKADGGVLFEALGDLYYKKGRTTDNITNSAAHETNPVYHAASGKLYFATWSDEKLGGISASTLKGDTYQDLTLTPSQYGSIAVSAEGQLVAFIRGSAEIMNGIKLENQRNYELVIVGQNKQERIVTDIEWSGNRYAKRPPTILFEPGSEYLYFSEYVDDVLTIKRIDVNGKDEQTIYKFLHATRAVISPDLKWIAYREYHRSYITPFEFAGKVLEVSAEDKKGFSKQIDDMIAGDFMDWTANGTALYWTRGKYYYEQSVENILNGVADHEKIDLSFEFDIGKPTSIIALTNVRLITMNENKEVSENITVLIENEKISAIGSNITIPDNAKEYDLTGHTIMPGIFDAHGHYGSPISPLNVIEQNLYGLKANLAYGVTTMFDVYGTTQKDFWVSDMLRKGQIDGPRIFSVGDPIFVTKYRSKMYRPIQSLADAEEHVLFNKDHGAPAVKDYSNHNRKARHQLAVASRKHQLNLVTESFSNPQMNMTQLIDGFTGIEHSMGLEPFYDDYVKMFAATKVGMTPTLIVVYNGPSGEQYFHMRERIWEDKKLLNFFRKEDLMRYRRPTHLFDDDIYAARMANELRKLYAAGVPLHMGAHGQMMGLGAHWEIELFVQGGFTPHQALEIATINGYRHHGLDHVLGSIEVGKLADMVILEKNPLDDIRNTRSIKYVMKNGVLYSGEDASRIYPIPQPSKKLYLLR
ncbi:MAG: amidohydrolase family protein [Bacteroidetes bacterium]|nr:amidohydrolase family protein [Bacteroidota bacterium]